MRKTYSFAIFLGLFFILLCVKDLRAATYYVNGTGGNDKNAGTIGSPWKTIPKANSMLKAGDTVYIRAGTYTTERIQPLNSGTAGSPITYARYQSESVTFQYMSVPVNLVNGQDYIVIDGFNYIGNNYSMQIRNGADHVEVKNCTFQSGRGYGEILVGEASYAYIHNNTFNHMRKATTQAEELPQLFLSNTLYSRVISNEFIDGGGHSMFETDNADYTVIRGNTFHNTGLWNHTDDGVHPPADAMITNIKQSDHNLYEQNTFYESGDAWGDEWTQLIKVHNSSYLIIRKNISHHTDLFFWSCYTSDTMPAPVLYNMIYGNTIYQIANVSGYNEGAFNFGGWGGTYPDIQHISILNNIVHSSYRHGIMAAISGGTGYHKDNEIKNNILYNIKGDDFWWEGNRLSKSQAEAVSPLNVNGVVSGNITSDPLFTDPAKNDFTPQVGSPAIDGGAWLTTITSASGSGKTFTVNNPYFFFDGWGIPNETGDKIKMQNEQTATITSINYSTKQITVDRSIGWMQNEGVALSYSGSKPYIGAYDSTQYDGSPISPPMGLKIITTSSQP